MGRDSLWDEHLKNFRSIRRGLPSWKRSSEHFRKSGGATPEVKWCKLHFKMRLFLTYSLILGSLATSVACDESSSIVAHDGGVPDAPFSLDVSSTPDSPKSRDVNQVDIGEKTLAQLACMGKPSIWTLRLVFGSHFPGSNSQTIITSSQAGMSVQWLRETVADAGTDAGAPIDILLTPAEKQELGCLVDSDDFLMFMKVGFGCTSQIFDASESFVFTRDSKMLAMVVSGCTLGGDKRTFSTSLANRIAALVRPR